MPTAIQSDIRRSKISSSETKTRTAPKSPLREVRASRKSMIRVSSSQRPMSAMSAPNGGA